MADEKYERFVDVVHVSGYSEVSFAAATKNALDGLYERFADREQTPLSFEVLSMGGTISPNPGKITYGATLAVKVGGP